MHTGKAGIRYVHSTSYMLYTQFALSVRAYSSFHKLLIYLFYLLKCAPHMYAYIVHTILCNVFDEHTITLNKLYNA